jgi:hypothetical protein
MRKVRDYDAELKALESRAKAIKARRVEQLGQLVTATGADALDMETLAGALLDAVTMDAKAKEAWRAKGAAFFQRRGRKAGRAADGNGDSTGTQPGVGPAPGSGAASD